MTTTNFNLEEPVVKTTHGSVRGLRRQTVYEDPYYCFDGIPYAKPPLGELRFKAPQPAEPWEGILDCTQIKSKSLQYNRYTTSIEGAEDCLYLNIYAKKLTSEQPLPVMAYIFGGGFNTGEASRRAWAPDYFMMQDVVFITIGYRLGALGFLSLKDPKLGVPGNAGLKDIVLALQWIQQNCRNFNGDPDNVTFFGHSAGAMATHLMLLSPRGERLFHKAIIMAGFAFHLQDVPNMEYRLAKHLGFEGALNDESGIYNFLCKQDAEKLVGFNFWTEEEKERGYSYAFGPSIEHYETADSIIVVNPIDLCQTAWSKNIPVMLGATSMEGLIQYKVYADPEKYEILARHPEYALPRELLFKCDTKLQKELAAKSNALHFGTKQVNLENMMLAIEQMSYAFMYTSQHRFMSSRLSCSLAPTFLYRFDFDSPTFNLYRKKHCPPGVRGVGHVDELSYIFYMEGSYKLERSSAEFLTITRMIDLFTAFAKRSDPNTAMLKPLVWKPVERFGSRKCLNISHELSFIEWPESAKCAVWESIYNDAGVKFI